MAHARPFAVFGLDAPAVQGAPLFGLVHLRAVRWSLTLRDRAPVRFFLFATDPFGLERPFKIQHTGHVYIYI